MKRNKIVFIVPVYKSEKTIVNTIKTRINLLETYAKKQNFDYQVLAVIDGNLDSSKRLLMEEAKKNNKLLVEGYEKNMGKGYALKHGFKIANGDYIGFIDDGTQINDKVLVDLIVAALKHKDIDVFVASKKHPNSKLIYPLKRRLFTKGYSLLTKLVTGINYEDTQVGAKLFTSKSIKNIVDRLLVKRFAIDIEILAIANMLGYNRHIDVPIEIDFNSDKATGAFGATSFKMIRRMVIDTLAVGYRLRIRRWYDEKNRHLWGNFK
jgi:glycosyltransferase involved in cell wall biosynthesis